MQELLERIRLCEVCATHLALGPRPVLVADPAAQVVIIGQAPGTKVHATGIPWDDPSGKQLRKWMGIKDEVFYNKKAVAIVPMGFCYPGKGKSGDLPPRPECAPLWHEPILEKMPRVKLIILIGMYAQAAYLENAKKTLTENVKAYQEFLPQYFVLPHPSPRNRFWLTKNPWFEKEVIPEFKLRIKQIVS